jgi:Tol biopolymer transport system component
VLKEVLGVGDEQLTKDWHAAIREAFAPVVAGKQDPGKYGPALITEKAQGGSLNIGPALSPDGNQIAFLSERDLFSIELFLADARSGSIERRLSHTAVDPHLESLQFINSSGSWDAAGKRLALGAVAKGRPLLVIIDANSGKRVEEIPFPTLGEIYTPSFAPDGNRLVFSAMANGFTDLFVYDLQKSSLQRLTQDAYADLQPAWSPDGKTIAFVTDRYSTRLDTLDMGGYRLAAIDAAGGQPRALTTFEAGKSINPQWAASSRQLYFLSDATGITNVYRLDLDGGEVRQLTDLVTGVSGITALSPALSSASASNKLVYSVYDEGRYEIYTIKDEDTLAGWQARPATSTTAGLIPGGQPIGEVLQATADATTGLADSKDFTQQPYKAKLGLDYVGQPYMSAGAGRYGAAFSGGISMSFSDMLGEHSLDTAIQADRVQGFTDVGGIFSYVNKVHRFNWGLQLAQIPYQIGSFASGVTTQNGQTRYVEQTLLQRQLERSFGVLGFYPINSATRFEAQAGYRGIGFDYRMITDTYAFPSGLYIGTDTQEIEGQETLHMGQGTVAFVHDTSIFGATSPILGRRLRLDVSPTTGSLNFVSSLVDLRQYVMPVRPLTIAARLMHYGRYGSGAEDQRMSPVFIGYQNFVRGYDTGSFSPGECGRTTDGSCPVYDQLIGSRMLVFNLEARIPLFALFGAKNLYGPLPIEVGAFFDSGVAWDQRSSPKLFGGERELVKSIGATARLNLFGIFVLQVDYAKPLDRPAKNAYFQFNLLQGF